MESDDAKVRTVEVPGPDDDILSYVAEIFGLGEGDWPTNCIVVLEFLPKDPPPDGEEDVAAWSVRTGGDARYSSEIGLLNMAAHKLAHDAEFSDDD